GAERGRPGSRPRPWPGGGARRAARSSRPEDSESAGSSPGCNDQVRVSLCCPHPDPPPKGEGNGLGPKEKEPDPDQAKQDSQQPDDHAPRYTAGEGGPHLRPDDHSHSQGHGQPYKPRVVPVKDMRQTSDPGSGDLDKLRGRRRDMGGKGEEGGEDGDLDDASADA